MKAFHFNLEAVRTLRQRQEHQAMEQYVRTLLARQQAIDHLEAIRERIKVAQEELGRLLSAGCTASDAHRTSQYQTVLETLQKERTANLAVAERRVTAAFQVMLQARQQRKIVEKYREKQVARHQRDAAREEQKMLDDLASRRTGSVFSWNPTEALA